MSRNKGNPSLLLLTSINIFGGLLFGYNTGSNGPSTSPYCATFFGNKECESYVSSFLTSSLILGAMIGSLAGGALCDKYGRKFSLCLGSIITTCGALATAFSIQFYVTLGFRGLLGIGVGIVGVVCPMYVSETAGEYYENKVGFLGTLFQLAITIGIDIAFLVGYLVHVSEFSLTIKWRIMIGAGVIPGLLLLLIGLVMSESKVWLREHREDRTEKTQSRQRLNFCSKSFFVGVMLAACLQLTGINVIMFFGPSLLSTIPAIKGNDSLILLLNLGIGVWNSITTLFAVGLIEKLGRKTLMIIGTIILTVAQFVSGVASFLPDNIMVIVITIGLGLFLLGFETGPGCLFWVLVNEVFDPEVRDQANGVINLLQWGFNLLVLSTFPFLLNYKPAIPFFLYGGIGVFVVIALQLTLKDKKSTTEYDAY